MKKHLASLLAAGLILYPIQSYAEETILREEPSTENEIITKEGWVNNEEGTFYYVQNEMVKGWHVIDNSWYYFDLESGKMVSGWLYYKSYWYYLGDTGKMQTGWVLDEGKWYYLSNGGEMQTGWVLDEGKWYYLTRSGAMQTGWLLDRGKWYYLTRSGEMQTGWLLDRGVWYYLTNSGAMQTGWLLYNNQWYYLNHTGAMSTGWVYVNNRWYFINHLGVMQTGWYYVNNRWYYSYSDGSLAVNTFVEGYQVGQSGAWIPDVVNPRQIYSYEQMELDIQGIQKLYPDFIQTQVIGQSVDGRNIYAVRLGLGPTEIFLNGAHHAREHMTTNVLMEMLDEYSRSFADGYSYGGYNTSDLLHKVSIWFVPMVNPDGVTLVQRGHTSAKNPSYVLQLNNNNTDFSSWKANIRGVDLNRQYPADWGAIGGPKGPAPMNFKGYSPLSEPEVIALYNFTKAHQFKTSSSYHSSGEILYWYYKQTDSNYNRDYQLALQYSQLTGYPLVAPTSNPGGGGYKDWFIQETKMPGFTPEISPYTNNLPVPLGNFDRIWEQNKSAGLLLAQEASTRP